LLVAAAFQDRAVTDDDAVEVAIEDAVIRGKQRFLVAGEELLREAGRISPWAAL
jgi:hypothetical protein